MKYIALFLIVLMPLQGFAAECGKNKIDTWYAGITGTQPGKTTTAETVKKQADNMKKFGEDLASKQENADKQFNLSNNAFMRQCVTAINSGLGGLAGFNIWNSIVQAAQAAACVFARQKSAEYISKALNMMQFELPFGLGTVGANTNIMGFTFVDTGLSSWDNAGIEVREPRKDAGLEMFRNGGSMIYGRFGGGNFPSFP